MDSYYHESKFDNVHHFYNKFKIIDIIEDIMFDNESYYNKNDTNIYFSIKQDNNIIIEEKLFNKSIYVKFNKDISNCEFNMYSSFDSAILFSNITLNNLNNCINFKNYLKWNMDVKKDQIIIITDVSTHYSLSQKDIIINNNNYVTDYSDMAFDMFGYHCYHFIDPEKYLLNRNFFL
ncbi:hypothetical protein AMV064 [Betaentomopoxvirus amoorei]|uniref:AMV064 n=1 Tax=Amsacta moorei entomopoxvirus TaxID=28321 RepID=Q9EMY5_AMEPV|nr:hypothetical protein AMV064 [Amsacta moorei entomopoxvirus]AAG02770.1 AMV064 [Amsacta moorei entomopoxvirus]